MLSQHYHQLIGKIEEHEGKKLLMVHDYMLDKVLDEIKETIGIVKFDDTKILIDTGEKLPDYITLKNILILVTCLNKNNGKFYPQIFLEEELYNE